MTLFENVNIVRDKVKNIDIDKDILENVDIERDFFWKHLYKGILKKNLIDMVSKKDTFGQNQLMTTNFSVFSWLYQEI